MKSDSWALCTEIMPKAGEKVLVCYRNSHGNARRVCAIWISAKTIESGDEIGDYDEANGCFYAPEGWYEVIDNYDEFGYIAITEGVPTHWQALPKLPEEYIRNE